MDKTKLIVAVAVVLREQGCVNIATHPDDTVTCLTPGRCPHYKVAVLDDGRLMEFVDGFSDPETYADMVAFRKSWQDGAVDLSVLVQAVMDRISASCDAPSMGFEMGDENFEEDAINHVADNYDVPRNQLRMAYEAAQTEEREVWDTERADEGPYGRNV